MAAPLTTEDVARLAGVDPAEIEQYREHELLDPDGDGVLDEMDILRLRILLHYRALGHTMDQLKVEIEERSPLILYADLLWAPPQEMVSVEDAAAELDLPPDALQQLLRAVGLGPGVPRDEMKFLE